MHNVECPACREGHGEKFLNYWKPLKKKLLTNPDALLKDIKSFEILIIKPLAASKQKLKQMILDPTVYSKEKIFKVSEPAGNLSVWVRAILETLSRCRA